MGKLARTLRIGEKISLGFGLVGVIFLVVIWQYHNTLQQSLADYRELQRIHVAKKVEMLEIESSMRQAHRAERDFLLLRSERFAREVESQLGSALRTAHALGETDAASYPLAEQITSLIESYHEKFQGTVAAWRTKGLDHDSGLQGAFRDAVHELEAMAGHFDVDNLYLQLLQIRRGEKDLGLRREPQYQQHVMTLLREFEIKVTASELEERVKQQLLEEITRYRASFEEYANIALAHADISGGKGPFRQTAHRIEEILINHQIPDLATNILQLRRREKDYLLRDDKRYVDMALQELARIHALVDPATISAEQKRHFLTLLNNYQRDFMALVEQNDLIKKMTVEMNQAVAEISALVERNVTAANELMQQSVTGIQRSTDQKERIMLWSVAIAILLGILFAVSITLRIVRPLRSMAGMLDQLAYEEPSERLAYFPEGRDEVNLMAGSVNTMADNKARLINWWKSSMREAAACENLAVQLKSPPDDPLRQEAETEFREALAARHALVYRHYQKIHELNGTVIKHAQSLRDEVHVGQTQTSINTISYSARSLQSILEMLVFQECAQEQSATDQIEVLR